MQGGKGCTIYVVWVIILKEFLLFSALRLTTLADFSSGEHHGLQDKGWKTTALPESWHEWG